MPLHGALRHKARSDEGAARNVHEDGVAAGLVVAVVLYLQPIARVRVAAPAVSPAPRLVPVATTSEELKRGYRVSTPSNGVPSFAMTLIMTVPEKIWKESMMFEGRGMSK